MAEWTRDIVEERIAEAAWVLKKLPGPRVRGYFSTWPDILRSAREIADGDPKPMSVLPSPQAISRMEEAITWNQYLERDDARLLWDRAAGVSWKELCYRFGISRPTATRRWEYALLRHRLAAQRPAGQPQARPRLPDPAGSRVTKCIGAAGGSRRCCQAKSSF